MNLTWTTVANVSRSYKDYKLFAVTGRPTFKTDMVEMVVSIFIMAFGVVLSVKANQGASPIVSLPNVLSEVSGLTLGTTLFIVYAIFIIIEWALIRDRKRILLTLSQLPFTMLFSLFVDAIVLMLDPWVITGLAAQWALIVISIFVIGFGVVLELDANISMLADDGLILAIHQVTRIPVSKVMIIFDVVFVASSFILSYAVFQEFIGVGLGTIVAGFTLGLSVKLFTRIVKTYIRKDGNIDSE